MTGDETEGWPARSSRARGAVGSQPGPVGGVTRSVEDLTAALRAAGHEVRYVDTGSPARALRALPGCGAGGACTVPHHAGVAGDRAGTPLRAPAGRTVLVLHSGAVRRQIEAQRPWRRAALARACGHTTRSGRSTPTSRRPCRTTGRAGPGRLALHPQPWPDANRPARETHLLTVATNSGLPHYNAELGVDVRAPGAP
jgi:hypothetical protein